MTCAVCNGAGHVAGEVHASARYYSPNPVSNKVVCYACGGTGEVMSTHPACGAEGAGSCCDIKIKPLVWREQTRNGPEQRAVGVGVHYHANYRDGDWYLTAGSPEKLGGLGCYGTLGAAKQTAQADFERRVRAAVAEPTPPPADPWEGLDCACGGGSKVGHAAGCPEDPETILEREVAKMIRDAQRARHAKLTIMDGDGTMGIMDCKLLAREIIQKVRGF